MVATSHRPRQPILQVRKPQHGLVLAQATYNREAARVAVIDLANVVSVRVFTKDSDTTGQYL